MAYLRVGPYDYKINPVCPNHSALYIKGKEQWAVADHKNLFFNIDETMDGQMQTCCLLHEVAHAWEQVSGSHWAEDETERELICDSIGTLMYQVIRDNPELCEKIWELSYGLDEDEEEVEVDEKVGCKKGKKKGK